MSSRGPGSIPVAIARLGFADPARAKSLLDDPALADLDPQPRPHRGRGAGGGARPRCPTPTAPCSGWCGSWSPVGARARAARPGDRGPAAPRARRASACSRCSAARPPSATTCAPTPSTGRRSPRPPRSPSTSGSAASSTRSPPRDRCRPADVLRTAYREQLLGIAALDLTSPDPTVTLPADRRVRWPTSPRPRSRRPSRSRAPRWGRMPTAPASRSSRWARPAAAS